MRALKVGVMSALALALTGCMCDREYQLRARQLANQAAHPATYELFAVEGPFRIEIGERGRARVAVPGQPFREISIPDGVRTRADLVRYLTGIGAATALGIKALDNVNETTTTTTVSNAQGGVK